MAVPEGAGSNYVLPAICLAFLVGIFGVLAFLATRLSAGEEEKPAAKPAGGGRARRGALDRMQRGAARAAAGAGGGAEPEGGEDDNDEGAGEDADAPGGRDARRKAQKDEKRNEKRAQQQAERQDRQQRESSKSDKQSKYSQRQQEKDAERQKREEEEQKAREDKEKKEQAEFDQWKEMFAVEAEGEDDGAGAKDESAVERFVQYVKVRKVVNLEDLAAEFRMRTSAAINRLEQLEKLGRLSGIFDDRGKYVYITTDEMAGVADWLKKRGRISRSDLVAACNRIVRLNPTEEDKEKLQQEATSAATALDNDADEAVEGDVAAAAAA